MGSAPRNASRCGCSMLGEEVKLWSAPKGRSLCQISSHENSSVHQCVRWWCDKCRQSEWMCLTNAQGRSCLGGREIVHDTPPSGFFPFSE